MIECQLQGGDRSFPREGCYEANLSVFGSDIFIIKSPGSVSIFQNGNSGETSRITDSGFLGLCDQPQSLRTWGSFDIRYQIVVVWVWRAHHKVYSGFLSVLIRLLWSRGTESPTHVTSLLARQETRQLRVLSLMTPSGAFALFSFSGCLLLPDPAGFISSPPSLFWLAHSWFLLMARQNSTSWHPLSLWYGRLRVCLLDPSPRSHWPESSSPSVTCKPNLWVDCLWPRCHWPVMPSAVVRVRGEWCRVMEGHLSGRAPRPWEFSRECYSPEASQFRASWTAGSAVACWVRSSSEFLTAPPICSCQIYYGTTLCASLPAASVRLGKLRGAAQEPPLSLLMVQEDPIQVADFGERGTSSLSPA